MPVKLLTLLLYPRPSLCLLDNSKKLLGVTVYHKVSIAFVAHLVAHFVAHFVARLVMSKLLCDLELPSVGITMHSIALPIQHLRSAH